MAQGPVPPSRSIEVVRFAFERRQPDAESRAQDLRRKLLAEASDHLRQAGQARRALAKGITVRERLRADKDSFFDFSRTEDAVAVHASHAAVLMAGVEAIDAIVAKHGGKRVDAPDEGPTTELLLQIRRSKTGDPMMRLRANEEIDDNHLKWAREIASINYNVTRAMHARTMPLPVKPDHADDAERQRRHRAVESREWMALMHSFVYLPWAWRRRAAADVRMVLAMIVDGESPNLLARKHRKRRQWVVDRVVRTLNSYGRIRRLFLKFGPLGTRPEVRLNLKPKLRPRSAASSPGGGPAR
jgi:hypothetical protein